jgi:uncharacterized RmlC-like cupin family protein
VGELDVAMKIGADELVPIESPPEIHRRQAFAAPGLWAGLASTEPGLASGWHHHDGHDTIIYGLSGRLIVEFGSGGGQTIEAAAGDFLVIPSGLVHREITPPGAPAEFVVVRSGGDGAPTVEVDGPSP